MGGLNVDCVKNKGCVGIQMINIDSTPNGVRLYVYIPFDRNHTWSEDLRIDYVTPLGDGCLDGSCGFVCGLSHLC